MLHQTLPVQTKLFNLVWLTVVHLMQEQNEKISKRFQLNIGCWNVKTLLDCENTNCPEHRTAIVIQELQGLNIDIAALSQKHACLMRMISLKCHQNTLYSGMANWKWWCFTITSVMDKVEQLCSMNDCIMKICIPLAGEYYLSLLSICTPVAMEENIDFLCSSCRCYKINPKRRETDSLWQL